MTNDYDDIINLPHYEPKHHPRMSIELIVSMLPEHPSVTIEYFVPDEHKAGGSYQSYTGNVKRIDEFEKCIEFTDGKRVPLDAIRDIKIE